MTQFLSTALQDWNTPLNHKIRKHPKFAIFAPFYDV